MGRVSDRSGQAAARAALLLEEAARQARRQRTVTRAVRAAWDVLAAHPGPAVGGLAFGAWQRSLGHAGPVAELFGVVCLAAGSPAGVAGSLYRAAGTVSKAPKGAVA